MLKKRGEWSEGEKRWAREGTIFVIALFVIGIVTFQFYFIDRVSNAIKSGMSSFAVLRMILPEMYLINFLPGAILGELTWSRIKKRAFKPRNVFILFAMLGEWVLVAAVLLTMFNLLFEQASFLMQFPLIALSLGLSSLIIAATSTIKGINIYVKKAFE
jgi:hypothetical protein